MAGLSLADRAMLIDFLLDTLEPAEEVEAAWHEEVTRRLQEIRGGKVKGIPLHQALEELRSLHS